MPRPRKSGAGGARIGQILVERGALDPGDLAKALALQAREDVRLGEILLTHGMVAEAELTASLAQQCNARIVDLAAEPPDPRLVDLLGADYCVKHRLVPWRRIGGATVIVSARPEEFARHAAELPHALAPALLAVASERDVLDALIAVRSRKLVRHAEARVCEDASCRVWDGRRFQRAILGILGLIVLAHIVAPAAAFAALTGFALITLFANMGLRAAALWTGAYRTMTRGRTAPPARNSTNARLPIVSIIVPLFHETAIAERLLVRLARISYPRELLDICLVTEDSDATTLATLAATSLPRWLRSVIVPAGTLRTKPRALNYALDFCRGSIIGIYDAEDAPAPDQIHRIVARFHERGPEVACLQGVLDYYNARSNWMARCFALEYAAWFRVILPGIERLGFAIPLGGTTLFLRRAAIEAVGGWDAHNVTEDADLGLRLARHGYRAELIDTVTEEEANSRPWPWIRQRSRWIKGYAMTWAVHMRAPRKLWREVGGRRFWGIQLLFGGSLFSVCLAPVLWSYWLLLFDLPHPLRGVMPTGIMIALSLSLIAAYCLNLLVMVIGASGRQHRHLIPWAVTVDLYYPLATIAAAKALVEMIVKPFYWDKTCHGIDDAAADAAPDTLPPLAPAAWAEPPRPALADPIAAGFTPETPAPAHRV